MKPPIYTEDGEYVLTADYESLCAELLAEIDRLRVEIEQTKAQIRALEDERETQP